MGQACAFGCIPVISRCASIKGGYVDWVLWSPEKISTIPTQYCIRKKKEEIFYNSYTILHREIFRKNFFFLKAILGMSYTIHRNCFG